MVHCEACPNIWSAGENQFLSSQCTTGTTCWDQKFRSNIYRGANVIYTEPLRELGLKAFSHPAARSQEVSSVSRAFANTRQLHVHARNALWSVCPAELKPFQYRFPFASVWWVHAYNVHAVSLTTRPQKTVQYQTIRFLLAYLEI